MTFGTDEYEKYFQKADSVVSISDKCVQILKQNYPALVNKFYCLPNLTSGSLLKKMSEEFEVSEFEKNQFNVLSIGRLTRQKGYDFAIDAVKILKEKYSDIHWWIIGAGELEEQLKKQVKDNELKMLFSCFFFIAFYGTIRAVKKEQKTYGW